MIRFAQRQGTWLPTLCALACLLPVAVIHAAAGPNSSATVAHESATTFDLVCTTTMDRVEGTLADGSPVVPSAVGEIRRYSFDLAGRHFASNGRVTAIHDIDGSMVVKADPDEIRSFAGVVHMQSAWHLDLDSGMSIRKNTFFSDASGTTATGASEWHQQCEQAPYSGMPAD